MEYSENNINPGKQATDAIASSDDKNADGTLAPLSQNSDNNIDGENASGAFAELFGVAVKAVALTVAFILLLTSVLAVCLPLQSMRIYNKLGFTARAVDFGERYISRELRSHGADGTDSLGNYKNLAATAELTNDDMAEALYVCINNSYSLMNEYLELGSEPALLEYYAGLVEKYTRMYLSLNGVGVLNESKSAKNMAAMPLLEMRPVVYNYGHTVRNMNYRAKAVLNETDKMLWSSNENGNIVTTLTERTNTLSGIKIDGDSRDSLINNIDMYIDYIDAIGEYIDVEFIRAGVENDPVKKLKYSYMLNGEKIQTEGYVFTESFVQNVYSGVLSDVESPFALLYTRESGFTSLYNVLQRFTEYAQAAVDFTPDDRTGNKLDEMLHQLYWLQTLSSTSYQLWYLDYLLYYSRDCLGASSYQISANYGKLVNLNSVDYRGVPTQLSEVYAAKLNEYKAIYQA